MTGFTQRHSLWHVRVSTCNRHITYHLLLQLIVFPVDQYHCFLKHWWERTHQRLSFDCECLLGKADWRRQPTEAFGLPALSLQAHISTTAADIEIVLLQTQFQWLYTQYTWFVLFKFFNYNHLGVTLKKWSNIKTVSFFWSLLPKAFETNSRPMSSLTGIAVGVWQGQHVGWKMVGI